MGSHAPSFTAVARALEELPSALRHVRRSRRLALRQVAEECGVPFTTLHRLECGGNCSLTTARAVLLWLDAMPGEADDPEV